jgi:hypothetical protein
MLPSRRLVTLLAVASLTVGAVPATAAAQDDNGAGDQQYQDPFGSSQTSAPAKKKAAPRAASSQGQGKKNGLSQTPNLGASGTAGASTGSTAPTSSSGSLELARTGGAPGSVALIGMALLLGGIGLRLRVADERR